MKLSVQILSALIVPAFLSVNGMAQKAVKSSKNENFAQVSVIHHDHPVQNSVTGKRKSTLKLVTGQETVKQIENQTDTLNYPLPGTYTLYTDGGGGYVTGNNSYGDMAKADKFDILTNCELDGILFDFAVATGGSSTIEFAVWGDDGVNNAPGTKLGSTTLPISTIINQVTNQQMTYVQFDPPIELTSSFYAGVVLPTTAGDTLALWSNTDGDTNPGSAWEQWTDGTWSPISSNDSWGLNISQAIFPIVLYGDLPLTANFMADHTEVVAGETVEYTDLSLGNPDSWQWTFEGGTPSQSTEQNPVVMYDSIGTFDVTLTVGLNDSTDTMTKTDYISVTQEVPVQIDTLNYPLPGTFAIYITQGNGYVTGNNEYGDLAKSNYFNNSDDLYITGMLMDFAWANGGNPSIEIDVWDNTGQSNSPGSKIGMTTIPLNTIKNNIANQQLSFVSFTTPIHVTTSFYAGFVLPTTAGDTLAVWSNKDGDTSPGTAWEEWSDGTWHAMSETNSFALNFALAVYPIVQNILAVPEFTEQSVSLFPNPTSGSFVINSQTDLTEIEIFNITGDRVLNQDLNSGIKEYSMDLSSYPAGIYFIRLQAGDKVFTHKLIVR